MTSLRSRSQEWNVRAPAKLAPAALLSLAALLALAASVPRTHAQQATSSSGWSDVNPAEYLQHLQTLDGVVTNCSAQFNLKTTPPTAANVCDPARVGPDDRLHWPGAAASEPREIRYDWLRSVLTRAGKKDSSAPAAGLVAHLSPKEKAPNVSDLLKDAHQRLQMDQQQAQSGLAANPTDPNLAYIAQRKSLDQILAQRAYKSATEVSVSDRFWEWFDNLLDKILSAIAGVGARAPWIGRLLEILLVGGALTVLVWLFVRIERNARVRLVPDVETSPDAPSAREWQLWLKDAQTAAAGGQWREAIHSVYWASISRLESRRLWPADRARTPREYLALLRGTDPRKSQLTALTRSFEHTWYGGREAAAADFKTALDLAAELGVRAE